MASRSRPASSRSSSRRKGKGGLSIPDLSGVEGRILVAEGEFLVEVDEVTSEEGDAGEYFKWVFAVIDDKKFTGAKLYYNTSLAKNSLWNLKTLLEALGVDIPDEAFDLDPEDLVGKTMNVSVEHDTWQGKKQAKIVDFWGEDETRDTEERGHGGGDRGSRDRDNDRGGRERDRRGGRSRRDEPADDELTQDAINDMDQEELEDVIKEHKLKCDLSDHNTLRKMRNAVIDAAEKKGVLSSE